MQICNAFGSSFYLYNPIKKKKNKMKERDPPFNKMCSMEEARASMCNVKVTDDAKHFQ